MISNQKKEARSKNNFEKARKRAPESNVLTNFRNLGRPRVDANTIWMWPLTRAILSYQVWLWVLINALYVVVKSSIVEVAAEVNAEKRK